MKIIACIQARMGSTRYPKKVIKRIGQERIIEIIINKLRQIKKIDDIVLLTSNQKEDIRLLQLAKKYNVRSDHSGNYPLQVFLWFKRFAFYNLKKDDWVIRVCGDSPFIDIDLIEKQIEAIDQNYFYISYLINNNPAILSLYGIFVELIKAEYLIDETTYEDHEIEHVTPLLYNKMKNKCLFLAEPDIKYPFKASIDYFEDWIWTKTIYKLNYNKIPDSYHEIEKIIAKYPELQYTKDMKQNYAWFNKWSI